MAVNYEHAWRRADLSGVSLVNIGAFLGAGVVVSENINDDFVRRFQACCAASDAIWHDGWLACRTDGERGAWIEHYADYMEDRLDS